MCPVGQSQPVEARAEISDGVKSYETALLVSSMAAVKFLYGSVPWKPYDKYRE
jgi:hypothetical protein